MAEENKIESSENPEKESLLDSLLEATSMKSTRYSRARKKKEPTENRLEISYTEEGDPVVPLEALAIPEKREHDYSALTDGDWEHMMDEFDELSPIDDITYEDRWQYRNRNKGDKYDELFTKEQSILNEVLARLNKRSKTIEKKVESMTKGKSTYGVTKGFTDLLEVGNSVETNTLNVVKELVNVKKTMCDLRMKEQKLLPEGGAELDRDTIADQFYKSIISGSSNEFIRSSMSSYADQGLINDYNISQPLQADMGPIDGGYEHADQYGYIQNENRNVEVCVVRHSDGSSEFVALDEGGYAVDNYELPERRLLDRLSIKPGANYAYDEYSRKYKLIEEGQILYGVPESVVPLDDLDDDYYSEISSDDKYAYADSDDEEEPSLEEGY